ncbi:MAG: hypothetical protein ACSHX6_01035 [Akkermansiaceae bacterium]
MRIFTFITLITGLLFVDGFAMTGSLAFKDKCEKSDAIVRGVVVDIIDLTPIGKASGGSGKAFSGPHSVALVRVEGVFKGESVKEGGIIFIPCGYSFDESPCELTKSREYFLFLGSMGRNYYHPLGSYCMHLVRGGKVGMSGFDWEGEFESKSENARTVGVDEFVGKIKTGLK